jgi:hypothetical protein
MLEPPMDKAKFRAPQGQFRVIQTYSGGGSASGVDGANVLQDCQSLEEALRIAQGARVTPPSGGGIPFYFDVFVYDDEGKLR